MFQTAIRIQRSAIISTTRLQMSTNAVDAIVLPVFPKQFSALPEQFKSSLNIPALWESTRASKDKALEKRLFHQQGPTLSLVAIGKEGNNENAKREASRKAIATGVKAARDAGARKIGIVSENILEHDAGEWGLG